MSFKLASLFQLIMLSLGATTLANAAVIEERTEYPEVIPGPGLPSLASLNLTSAELYERVPTDEQLSTLKARFNLQCGFPGPACPVANAVACFNFLNALGHQACGVNGDNVMFCTAGGCNWFGSNISGGPSASSFCSDVAIGGDSIINQCQSGGTVCGATAANGNGNLVVTISEEA